MVSVILPPQEITLSIVIVSHNMARELPRTLQTLVAPYQKGISELQYEIIIVDNGSTVLPDIDRLFSITPLVTIFSFVQASKSPVDALNFGLSIARGKYVCAWIDGARMATPRLLAEAVKTLRSDARMVVGALSLHLGPEPQNWSVKWGYNQAVEDELLNSLDWLSNGYVLFNVSSFDPSSRSGYFSCPAETNCLFMSRDMWREFQFYDPAFQSKGGGLANLDLWCRLCNHPDNTIVLLAGEATFHQVHGGVTTNAVENQWVLMNSEYATIRGHDFIGPVVDVCVRGSFNPFCKDFLARNGFVLNLKKLSQPGLNHYLHRLLTQRGRSGVYDSVKRHVQRLVHRSPVG